MQNAINWFEIPALNLERAASFYDTILNQQLRRELFAGMPHAIFPADEAGVAGAVVLTENHQPGDKGVVIYLNAGKDLDSILSRIPKAGGSVLMPKTSIGEQGFIALLKDTEGNKVGLHQPL